MKTENVNLSIKINAEVKRAAEDLLNRLGMNMTTAITLFLKQALRNQSIPFAITMNRQPKLSTIRAIEEALEMEKTGKGPVFHTVDELWEDLFS